MTDRRAFLKTAGLASLAPLVMAAAAKGHDLPPLDIPDVRTWDNLNESQRAAVTHWLKPRGGLEDVTSIHTIDADAGVVEITRICRAGGQAHDSAHCPNGAWGERNTACKYVDRVHV